MFFMGDLETKQIYAEVRTEEEGCYSVPTSRQPLCIQ
jgi:hypothetical protein